MVVVVIWGVSFLPDASSIARYSSGVKRAIGQVDRPGPSSADPDQRGGDPPLRVLLPPRDPLISPAGHDAIHPDRDVCRVGDHAPEDVLRGVVPYPAHIPVGMDSRSEEHTSELQSRPHLVCRLLLEKKKKTTKQENTSI